MAEAWLGQEAVDTITGFRGTVIGMCKYLTGCTQYSLIPRSRDGAYIEGRWFDEQRLTIITAPATQLDNSKANGADFDPPTGY